MTVTNLAPTSQRFRPGCAFSRLAAVAGLLVSPFASCTCEPVEPLEKEGAQIWVDVCAGPIPLKLDGVGNTIGGFTDCGIDFGNADIAVKTSRSFRITNTTRYPLNIESIALDGTEDAFKLVEPLPEFVGAGLSVEVAVEVRPRVESVIATDIVITSDAINTGDEQPSIVRIPVTLTGVDNGLPDIEVTPDAACGSTDPLGVDFGNIATGGVSICEVTISNVGTRDLFFDSAEFADIATGVLHIEPSDSDAVPNIAITGTLPTGDVPLPGCPDGVDGCTGNSFKLRLAFAPDALGAYSSKLAIATSDPDESVVELPIIGTGVVGPTCVASIKSVNGVTEPPFTIEPLDDVTVTTEGSTPATPEVGPLTTTWDLRTKGAGSSAVLSDPTGKETGLLFANRRGVDVAGRFELCATVTDTLGTSSTNNCCVDFEAIPSQAFLVQATWANPDGDMDLHVTKQNDDGDYCVTALGGGAGGTEAPFREDCSNTEDFDCYFANRTVNWDNDTSTTEGDPSLDIDDTQGFGPENTNVDVPLPGSYAFGLSAYRAENPPYLVTIRLFIFGRPAGEWTAELGDDDQFLEAGIAHFKADDFFHPCVEDLTDGDPADECP
jgi:hypothetical protein